ncbi:ATP-binding protein [Haloplanus litoreus]
MGNLMPKQSGTPVEVNQFDVDEEVFLCFGHENNRQMLARELQSDYHVTTADSILSESEFALYIVDEPGLEQCYEELQAVRTASEPIIRPCLLVTSSDVKRIDPSVWEVVDDVITTPISMAELRPRIESLLRLYRLSVDYGERRQLEQVASILSHDLRNPLSVAQGNLELAREDGDDEYFERTARALERIEDLLGDVLTLVRQDYSASDFELVSVDTLARETWDEFDSGESKLVVEIDGQCSIRANRSALMELFTNLFRNAKDHNERPVTVTIGVLADGFYVADDGNGIPEAKRERIFESGFSTQSDGTGLGLSIVEQVTDAHDWTVSVTESDTGGARFEVTDVLFEQPDSESAGTDGGS